MKTINFTILILIIALFVSFFTKEPQNRKQDNPTMLSYDAPQGDKVYACENIPELLFNALCGLDANSISYTLDHDKKYYLHSRFLPLAQTPHLYCDLLQKTGFYTDSVARLRPKDFYIYRLRKIII